MLKKVFVSLLCICMLLSPLSAGITASAMEIRSGTITVDTVKGFPGETAVVSLKIEDNPGIMAFAITILYDSADLTYEDYFEGDVLSTYNVVDNPEKGSIRFVTRSFSNIYTNGTLISLKFKIKDDAGMGLHKVRITSTKGDFSDWDENVVIPKTVLGGVEVQYNGNNCPHKHYTEWQITGMPSCEKAGLQQRFCEFCAHAQNRSLAPLGHSFEEEWTVDLEATPESDGIMSRHCIRCSAVTEQLTYTYKQSEDEKIDNTVNSSVSPSDFTEQLKQEQKPQDAGSTDDKTASEPDTAYYEEEKIPSGLFAKLKYYLYEKSGIGIVGKISEAVPDFEKVFSFFCHALRFLTHIVII